jgi:hypothetical protein
MRSFVLRGVIGALLLLFATAAHAQFDSASIGGTVRDVSGAVVPDAKVTVTSTATGVSLTQPTNGSGVYEFVTVRPGTYLVTAEKAGFSIALVENVELQVAARLRVDLQMQPGQVSETVQVTATAPLLETDSSQRGDPYASNKTINAWFNPACVTIPTDPSQPFGNAPRNSVRGPGYWTVDLAVSKYLPLSGAARLQLRLEAFNLVNRRIFAAPNAVRSAAQFGTITATYDPRQVQLGAKVLW